MDVIPRARPGYLFALAAYLWWGLTPLFWKLLSHVPPLEILCHRVAWSFVFFLPLLVRASAREKLRAIASERRNVLYLFASTALIGVNWGTFIVAMVTDRVLESSIGYFMAPLAMVLLAVVLLRESLSSLQAIAVVAASVGVLVFSWGVTDVPWIAIGLAGTFAFYGYFKKLTQIPVWLGIAVEASLLSVPALIFLALTGSSHDAYTWALLVASGPITALPQIWFALGARSCPYALLGFMQFLSPTMAFFLAVFLFHEPFGASQGLAFLLLWTGVAAFSWDLWRRAHPSKVSAKVRGA